MADRAACLQRAAFKINAQAAASGMVWNRLAAARVADDAIRARAPPQPQQQESWSVYSEGGL